MKSIGSIEKFSSQSSPKPKSSKTSLMSIKTREDIDNLNKETSKQVIKSVYQLITSKFPLSSKGGEISERDQEDIQRFFLKKKIEFSKLLEEVSDVRKKAPRKLKKKLISSGSLSEKAFQSEIELMHKKKNEMKKELIRKASEKVLKRNNIIEKQKKIDQKRRKKEEEKLQEYEKTIIIQNIENFYKDRIVLIKDSIQKELEERKIMEYDERQYLSSVLKQQREIRKNSMDFLKNKYELELESLKQRFDLI